MLKKNIKIYKFNEISSTNDFLLNNITYNQVEVCIANKQTKGRGQYGRVWLNQKKNALFSLKIPINTTSLSGFSLVVGLSIIWVLTNYYKLEDLLIKWPNDIYYNEKKLSGILIENQIINNHINLIIGVGINISGSYNFANINKNINIKQLIMRIVDKILLNTNEFIINKLTNFYEPWQKYDYLVRAKKKVKYNNIIYQIIGIDNLGNLLIKNDNNIVNISSSKQIQII